MKVYDRYNTAFIHMFAMNESRSTYRLQGTLPEERSGYQTADKGYFFIKG